MEGTMEGLLSVILAWRNGRHRTRSRFHYVLYVRRFAALSTRIAHVRHVVRSLKQSPKRERLVVTRVRRIIFHPAALLTSKLEF